MRTEKSFFETMVRRRQQRMWAGFKQRPVPSEKASIRSNHKRRTRAELQQEYENASTPPEQGIIRGHADNGVWSQAGQTPLSNITPLIAEPVIQRKQLHPIKARLSLSSEDGGQDEENDEVTSRNTAANSGKQEPQTTKVGTKNSNKKARLKVGDKKEVLYDGKWWAVRILKVLKSKHVDVEFDVDKHTLRIPPSNIPELIRERASESYNENQRDIMSRENNDKNSRSSKYCPVASKDTSFKSNASPLTKSNNDNKSRHRNKDRHGNKESLALPNRKNSNLDPRGKSLNRISSNSNCRSSSNGSSNRSVGGVLAALGPVVGARRGRGATLLSRNNSKQLYSKVRSVPSIDYLQQLPAQQRPLKKSRH